MHRSRSIPVPLKLIGATALATAVAGGAFVTTAAAHNRGGRHDGARHGAAAAQLWARQHRVPLTTGSRQMTANVSAKVTGRLAAAKQAVVTRTSTTHVAHHLATQIVLPGATSAEGLASVGPIFFAGDLFQGDIYRGNLLTGKVAKFIDAPAGRNALGIKVDVRDGLLFVAGGPTGQAYVYNLRTGADVAQFQFGTAGSSFVNDVVVTKDGAWFTDSLQPVIYHVAITGKGQVGAFDTLPLNGPAAAITGSFNLNGIAAVNGGKTLIVAHTTNGALYAVNPETGDSAAIGGAAASLPNVDGILLKGGKLFAVQNTNNQVSELRLSPHLTTATLLKVITDPRFETPTAVARFGNRLAVVNAKFDTGFPPTATTFEVNIVKLHGSH